MGQHHGYNPAPAEAYGDNPGQNNNSFDIVIGPDQGNNIRYWKAVYYVTGVSNIEPKTHPGAASENTRKDLAGIGPDQYNWRYRSIYLDIMGFTGRSSWENLTHLWDPVVKFNTGRGSWPSNIYTHYTNRCVYGMTADFGLGLDSTPRWNRAINSSAGDAPDYSECSGQGATDHRPAYQEDYFPIPKSAGATYGKEFWNESGGDYMGLKSYKPDLFDERVSWYHAHSMNFYDPAIGMPALNQYQCGSARVYLSGMWHTFCPGTQIVVGPGQVATLPSTWTSIGGSVTGHAMYSNNPHAYNSKGYVPYHLGLSGELIPVPEPNAQADQITSLTKTILSPVQAASYPLCQHLQQLHSVHQPGGLDHPQPSGTAGLIQTPIQ
jgi:hypothetical protein